MKTTIITILSIIILISMVNALDIYPGETITFKNEMGITNLVYTIVGNSTNVSPLIVEINSTNISITFPQDMIPDSFNIIFLEELTKTVVQTVTVGGGGGGGTRTVYRDKIIPEIFEREVIKEVPGDIITETKEIEVEKVINKAPVWMLILLVLGGVTLVIMGIVLMNKE